MTALRPIDFADFEPELRDALGPRVERLGYLGDFFRLMAHQPMVLLRFEQFTQECKRALGAAHCEVVALTAATRLGNDYERHQHERLAVTLGLATEWIAATERLQPDDPASPLDPAERVIQRFVLASIESLVPPTPEALATASTESLDRVVELCGEATAGAVALLTARFVGHALVSRACALTPPVASIFAGRPVEHVDAGA